MLWSNRRLWAWLRLAVGAGILGVLLWRLGTRPFLEALGRIDVWSLLGAAAIGVVTTVCCAWRWRVVSRGMGSNLPLGEAIAAYYGSQFLNSVLPGGVLGDVHRAVRRGRDVGDVGHGVRVVLWERTAGQVVQVVVTIGVLLVVPSPVHAWMPLAALVVGAVALSVVLLDRALPRRRASAVVRLGRVVAADMRAGLLARGVWPRVVLASVLALGGNAATFLLAAHTAGVTVSPLRLLPLALLVLLAMSLPTNVAGWGPREGMAAWAFAAAGLGAAQGLATAVVFGVMVLVATLPGGVVLLAASLGSRGGGPDSRSGTERLASWRVNERPDDVVLGSDAGQ